VHDASRKRSVKDVARGGEVIVPADGVSEPFFHRSRRDGVHEHILPGNERYVQGDIIPRPPSGEDGSGASADGELEDEFRFALTDEEFLDLFLEDLELPDLAKRQVMGEEEDRLRPAGFRTAGPPPSVSIPRTMRNSLSRRIALKRPRPEEIAELIDRIVALEEAGASEDEIAPVRAQLERLEARARLVPFIDPLDVRYRRHEIEPRPVARAVMFCLMDVSGSMDEHMKDLAKRFYSLLYLFLTRRYNHVSVVFIRHTHEAKEVDEDTFFYSRESGGTIVSTALEEMARIVQERFPTAEWNIYAAQASDGDNLPNDNARTTALLENVILPLCQYYAYIEVGHAHEDDEELRGASSLWRAYKLVSDQHIPIAMRKVRDRREIFPVFRELFARKDSRPAEEAPAE
jgi:uncharacterized sporulation protein YeaH/YhbH (DUF444 family)